MHPPFDPDAPPRPEDRGRLYGLPHGEGEARVVVIPVPWDATSGGGDGSAGAPQAILEASHEVGLHDFDTGDPWKEGIALGQVDPRVPSLNAEASAAMRPILAGDGRGPTPGRAEVDRASEVVNGIVGASVDAILGRGAVPGVIGGDHSVAFGAIAAAAARVADLGVLHVGARAHLRQAHHGLAWSHASTVFNLRTRVPELGRVVQVGLRDLSPFEARLVDTWDDVVAFTDADLTWATAGGEGWDQLAARIVKALPPQVWISFHADGLEPQLCPGSHAPVPGGLSWREAMVLLRSVAEHAHRIVGFDLCGVGRTRWDGTVGARLLYKLAGWSIVTSGAGT